METSSNILNEPDLYELIIKHLVRSKLVQDKAIELGMQSDDLMTQPIGNAIYKQIADICLGLKYAPVEPAVLCLHLKDRMQNGFILEQQLADVGNFVSWIYSDGLCEEYIQSILGQFIKVRRIDKIKLSSGADSLKLQKELSKLAIDFPELESDTATKSILTNPFDVAVVKEAFLGVRLGFPTLDAITGGIGLGEYVLLLGFSGCGKSLMGTNIVRNIGKAGRRVLFLSAEEEAPDIFQRIYAQQFRINYSELHQGRIPKDKLQALIDNIEPEILETLRKNIKIVDLKAEAPINTNKIKAKLEQFAKEGFIPELVIIDQLEFLEVNEKLANEPAWKAEDRKSDECDLLSHHLIAGEHKFGLIVLHQVNGNPKRTFNRTDIAGFKGIINPADTVLGIGRENVTSDEFCIFTLKSRHSKNFELDFFGELEYMTLTEMDQHRKQSAEVKQHAPNAWKKSK